jgi:uncharacterized protein (DUF488 family)
MKIVAQDSFLRGQVGNLPYVYEEQMALRKIVTIGVYGFTEAAFFQALQEARVDVFCDVRRRRGVRGAAYAFANSQRLQARLAALGIHYRHCKELAPPTAVRQRQQVADKAAKVAKRRRDALSPDFIAAYQAAVLADFEPQALLQDLPPEAQTLALFCVERDPAACHRSLAAEKLQQATGVSVVHIAPAPEGG